MSKMQRRFLSGHNYYVPAMQAFGDLGEAVRGRISLGAPIVANTTGILAAQSIASAVDTTTFAAAYAPTDAIMGRFGRGLTVVASGAATSTVTVYGRDYLGQKMKEVMTLNGTTPVVGLKAFKYIDRVVAGVTAATTIDLGFGAPLGLPYVVMAVAREFCDNVVGAAGTLVAPVFTDPATTTTGDPRGRYTTTTALNGTRVFEIDCEFSNYVNSSGNGGAHGIAHNGW